MTFDMADPEMVLAGTIYGEARGCGRAAMENVAQVILNRAADGWAADVVGVCLAPMQFSCWNENDPNRAEIIAAGSTSPPSITWATACAIAALAITGQNPDRVNGADSYFARSMAHPPFWAKPPAVRTFTDGWHAFWRVRPAVKSAPVISAKPSTT